MVRWICCSCIRTFSYFIRWPGLGYAIVIEPQNIVKTQKGNRARIVYAYDINQRTYHVGNSNQFSLGICIAGDYRSDKDNATKASIAELHTALVTDQIGNQDKSHHEMPGYSWKACCVYNYKAAFMFLNVSKPTTKTPATYKIQEGDTF
ncbi:N-acetylmuramoyl-L-alanine amidase [Pseudogracilibacillus auburnensis]|nr:N-acetylmuramoyl-L-alanine amidase [Pseudogracilibacillus auburnensis]